ncbi:hypothetical protein DER45DRAFT_557288 [Fusarium avenaceum]|nr:hypothetical protein DER45DRAFT_557288 [Fusarium avenaceum]
MEDKKDSSLTHHLREFGRGIESKIRPGSRKSSPIPRNRSSRVSTIADRATDNVPSQGLGLEHGTSNASRPVPSIEITDSSEPAAESNTTLTKINATLWSQAYIEAKEDPEFVKLLESYKKFLIQRYGLSQNESSELFEPLVSPEAKTDNTQIQKLAQRTLDDLESSYFTFRIGKQRIVVQEQVKKILELLTTFKSVIGAAAAAEPSASLAWTGIMAALPFLENIVKQDESAVDGFERISFLLIRYTLLEKDLLNDSSQHTKLRSAEHISLVQSIRERIIKVYTIVYQYQIRIILQYAHGKPRRMVGDMFLRNDWKKMTKDINEKDNEIDRAVNSVAQSWLKDHLDRVDYSIKKSVRKVVDLHREILSKIDTTILDRIPYVKSAVFDSPQVDKQGVCMVGTQYNALSTIQSWAESLDGDPIFWLVGMAGTGKSSIARTVANCLDKRQQFYSREPRLDERTILGATFFLSQEDPERNTVKLVFPTLARTLAVKFPDLGDQISQSFCRDTTVGHKNIVEQMRRLISEPMAVVSKALLLSVRLIIIIDSLDECEDSSEAEDLLRMLPNLCKYHPLDVRVLVISRPVKHISNILGDPKFGAKKLTLEKIPRRSNGADLDDITKFMRSELKQIINPRDDERGWVTDEDIRQLVDRADGLFIYAATTCRFLNVADDDEEIQVLRLKKLIEGKSSEGTPEARLDEIYRKVLSFPARNMSREEKMTIYTRYRCILGSIAIAFEPPLMTTLKKLTGKEGLGRTLMNFRSILEVHTDNSVPLTFYHLSFRDFLLSKERSGAEFAIDEAAVHRDLFLNCFRIMKKNLDKDICDLRHPGTLASDVPKDRVDEYIPQHLKYACLYFSRHLMKLSTFESTASHMDDDGIIYQFFSTKLLGWLEALSLLREYGRSITIIKDLQSLVTPEGSPKLSLFLQDAYRFALKNNGAISLAPLQTYCSALIFSPSKSLVRAKFLDLIPTWVTRYPDFREQWDPELMTLPGSAYTFDISGDGKTLVSRDYDETMKVWDLSTGSEMARFSYPGTSSLMAISRNSKTVACVLTNRKILLQSLTDEDETLLLTDNKEVVSIAFSPTKDMLAALSIDNTLLIWDLKTLELIQIVDMGDGKENDCSPLVFSPCGQVLLAGGGQAITGGIFVWNLETQTSKTVMKHQKSIEAIAISPDGYKIASSDESGHLIVWSEVTEATLSEIKFRLDASPLAWHPTQPTTLAVAQDGRSVSLCNTATALMQVIKHVDVDGIILLRCLAFTSSLGIMITGDSEGRVRMWDTGMASTTLRKREHIRDIHFLENEKRVLIVSEHTSEILDLDTGSRKPFQDDLKKVVRSPSRDLFAVCLRTDTIEFWDRTLSNRIRTYSQASDIFFPQDSTVVVLMSRDKGLVLDDQTLSPQSTIELPGQWVSYVKPVFTGQEMILVAKVCETELEYIFVYRLATGNRTSDYHYPIIRNGLRAGDKKLIHLSPDGEILIYQATFENWRSCYVAVYFKTNISKEVVLPENYEPSTSPVFSPTGDHVAIGTSSGNIFVWDTKSMSQVKNLVTGTSEVFQIHFCTSERIAAKIKVDNRFDIQLWDMERPQLLEEMRLSQGATGFRRRSDDSTGGLHFDSERGWLQLQSYDKTNLCSFVTERDSDLLDVKGVWIWQGNDRILLLPAEYYEDYQWVDFPYTTMPEKYYPIAAVCGGRIVLGLESGDVTAFEFDRSKMSFERKPGHVSGA